MTTDDDDAKQRVVVLEDWARRWIAERRARFDFKLEPGQVPPWSSLNAALELNRELERLMGEEPVR